jgi:hypothetical protein
MGENCVLCVNRNLFLFKWRYCLELHVMYTSQAVHIKKQCRNKRESWPWCNSESYFLISNVIIKWHTSCVTSKKVKICFAVLLDIIFFFYLTTALISVVHSPFIIMWQLEPLLGNNLEINNYIHPLLSNYSTNSGFIVAYFAVGA